jgi:hypothetical protein
VVRTRRNGLSEPLGHLLGYRAMPPLGDLLGEPLDPEPLLPDDFSLVGSDLPAEQPQECTLALAIAAQEADPLAAFDVDVDVIQQPRTPEGQADITQAQ